VSDDHPIEAAEAEEMEALRCMERLNASIEAYVAEMRLIGANEYQIREGLLRYFTEFKERHLR
jgi:hypothetical protein